MIKRLKILRKNILELTQTEFSKSINLKQNSYSKIENGSVALTERNIKTICEKFNVNEDWLRNGNEHIFNNDYSTINDKVKKIRELLNLSQEEFASNIGLKKSAISDIERGKANLTERNINLICQTFNVNEDWLRNGNEPIFIEKEEKDIIGLLKENGVKPMVLEIIENYLKMPDESKNIFDSYLKELVGPDKYNDSVKKAKDNIKDFPKQEEKEERVQIIARGKGITTISKEEFDKINETATEIDNVDDYF